MNTFKTKLKSLQKSALFALCMTFAGTAHAQLSTNPDKFLGNITTSGSVNPPGLGIEFASLWNQITPENETKWASVQGNRSSFNWNGADNCVNYARNHNFPFKFHCLLWGSQYPNWIKNLNIYDRKLAVVDWMDAVKSHYGNKLDLIDVVNEAVPGHQQDTPIWFDPLGGQGVTGYDWIVKAFEMAHERFPEAILIYNDYNTFQWNVDQFIDLVTKLRDAGAPIDAYGCQSHDLTDCNINTFKNSMNRIQDALKMPMYISEYDLGTYDDNHQKNQMEAQFPVMWEADYCAGVTLWGYIYGRTWTDDGNSGLIKNGVDRPAMTWLRGYMETEAAKTAKSPYPGMKKPISLYIKPAKYKAPINEPNVITVDAKMHNGTTIEKVELYQNDNLVSTMTAAPYTYEITPTNTNKINLKAIVYTSDGKTYERLGGFFGSLWPQHPYTEDNEPTVLPGVLEAENYDMGGESISYHTSRTSQSTAQYRDDQENVGILKIDEGYYIDQQNEGDWIDYTVRVNKNGTLKYEAIVGTTTQEGSGFTILISKDGDLKKQVDIEVPYTGRRKFTNVKGSLGYRFSEGNVYKLRFLFNKGKAAIDKLYIGVTEEEMGINEIMPDNSTVGYYDLNGRNVNATQKGITIERKADGTTRKVIR